MEFRDGVFVSSTCMEFNTFGPAMTSVHFPDVLLCTRWMQCIVLHEENSAYFFIIQKHKCFSYVSSASLCACSVGNYAPTKHLSLLSLIVSFDVMSARIQKISKQ